MEVESVHRKELQRHRNKLNRSNYCQRFYLFIKRYFSPKMRKEDKMDQETRDLFACSSPRAYFFTVEFVFLLQSFYLAVYLTQMLPIAVNYGYEFNMGIGAAWGIALFISPCIGLFFLRYILAKSVLLHATCYLNVPLVSKVCDETILE